MTAGVYLMIWLLAVICMVLVCLCIEHFYDALYNPKPPPRQSVDWQAIERQSRAVQDKAQAAFKARPRVPPDLPR